MPRIFQPSAIQVRVLKRIFHFCYCEEFSLLCSPHKNKSLMESYICNCSCMQDRTASAKCWLFVSTNVIRNTCNILACSKSVIQRCYHIYLADSLYHMEAITFDSRCILVEIKTGVIPSLPGEEKMWDTQKGKLLSTQISRPCLEQCQLSGGFKITRVVNASYGPPMIAFWWSYNQQSSEWACFQVKTPVELSTNYFLWILPEKKLKL